MPQVPNEDLEQLRALAESLGCYTEEQLLLLTGWSAETAKTKRKRGEGPPYVRHGKRVFYPREAYQDFMQSRRRARPTRCAAREAL